MEADPAIVLEWLDSVNDELRELQLTALEQLCNEVLFSDNVDVFFERYPPRLFIPALCKIFLDELAPDSVLEANARALTYYLDVSLDCAPRIARSPNVLTAMTSRLDAVDMTSAKSNELGQQIIKMLQLICTREPGAVYMAGGLTPVLRYIRLYPHLLHADVLQAGMDIIRRLFSRADPTDKNVTSWIDALSSLLDRRETGVADQALRAFANLVARFTRTGTDPSPLADSHIIDCLLQRLRVAGGVETDNELTDSSGPNLPTDTSGSGRDGFSSVTSESNPVAVHAVTNILTSLCCNSVSITHKLLTSDGQFAMTLAMVVQRSTDELVVLSVLRLIEILLVLLYQTQNVQLKSRESSQIKEQVCKATLPDAVKDDTSKQSQMQSQLFKSNQFQTSISIIEHAENSQNTSQSEHTIEPPLESQHSWEGDAIHRHFIEAIKRQDLDFMKRSLKSGKIDVNYMDHLGQTLLNWAASFGSPVMVELLCTHGANVNLGVRTPLDYAASFGRVEICKTLLNWGADINKQDVQGRKPIDMAREHPDFPGSQQVIDLLESESKKELNKSDKQLTPGSSSTQHKPDEIQSNDSAEAQRLFIDQLLPLLVGLFKESTSSVRHQCTLLVWRMIQYMRPDHLEKISLMDNQSVPFAFSLTQMIYTILIEEREELISRALELSLRLLNKTPHIYILVFYRLGLIPLIQIIIDILQHLLITENKSGVTVTTVATPTTNTGQQLSVPSSSDENEGKDVCTASEVIEELSLKNTLVTDKENKSKSVKNIEKQRVHDELNVNLNESKNYMPEILSTPANEDEEQQHQPVLPSTSISERVHLDAQLYNWNGWYFFCMGQLLSIFNGFAFITIQLQPEDGGLRVLCIHNSTHRNSPVPIQLHPGENPFSRPSLKSRMLRMHQHLMELIDSNITITPLFKDVDTETAQTTENDEGREQINQLDSVKKQTQLNILTHSSLSNLEASHNNARRFRRRLGLRHDPISINLAATTMGGHTSKLQRQASSPARVCLTSRFSTRIPIQSNPTGSIGLLTSTTSVSFGSIICSLLKRKDGTYVSVKPRAPTVCNSKSFFNEALLFSENSCSGFKRVRIASISQEKPVSSVNTNTESNNAESKTQTNPNVLLNSTKRHSRSFINTLNIGMDYLNLCDTTSFETPTENNNTTDFIDDENDNDGDHKFSKTDQLLTTATNMELSRIDKLFFPNEIIHETYNSGQLVVLLRTEDDDSRSELTTERLILIRKHMLTLANQLLERLQIDSYLSSTNYTSLSITSSSSSLPSPSSLSGIIDKIGPINALNRIKLIVMQIWDIFKTDKDYSFNETLNKLFIVFKNLSNLLNEGEQTITAYELTTSGLIQVLLLCLSVAHAGRWYCHIFSMELDNTTALLWYLQERRRVFILNMLSYSKSKSISLLVRRLVQAFELTEHLPLRLFSAAHLLRSSFTNTPSDHHDTSNHKLDRNNINDDNKTVKNTNKNYIRPTNLINKIGYSASLPINFINFSFNRWHSGIYTDHGDPVSITVKQPFQDSMDAKELAALLRFCPILLDYPEFDSCFMPSLHQIAKRLPLYLDKLSNLPSAAKLKSNNSDSTTTENKLHHNKSKRLYNWRGKLLFVSPLATVGQLERFLNRMSTKQCLWSQIHLANSFNSTAGLYFPAPPPGNSSADYLGGIIDWLATNGNRRPLEDWINPAIVGLVSIAASTSSPVKGRAVSILGPQAGALVGGYTIRGSGIGVVVKPKRMNCSNGSSQNESRGKKSMSDQKSSYTSFSTVNIMENETHAWIAIDLGLQLIPTAYTLAYLRRADASEHSLAPRNWKLEASNDAITWIVLREHNNDSSIQSVSGSRATWSINSYHNNYNCDKTETISSTLNTACTKKSIKGWRFFKIQTTGTNADGGKQLALGGLEFYGNVYSVYHSVLTPSILAQRIYSISSERKDISPPPQTITTSISSSSWLTVNVNLSTNNQNGQINQNEVNDDANDINNRTVIKSDPEEITDENSSSKSSNLNITLKQIDNNRRDPKSSSDEIVHCHHITSIIPSDTLMNILFDEEAGSDDNMMTSTSKSDVDMILELSAKKLDNLNILSSGTIDDKLLQCFGNLLANDNSSPELYQLLRRIASQDMDYDLSNKCTSHSMDSIHSREEEEEEEEEEDHHSKLMINHQSEDTKRIDSIILDTGEIDITEPHISYIDQSNTEASGESDVPGLGYLLNSIEPEAIEFADTVEAIIRSNTVKNRRNNNNGDDNENPIDLTIDKISQAPSHSWEHFQSIQNANHKNNPILVDQLIHSEEEKEPEKICDSIGLLTHSTSYTNSSVIKTVNTEPCNNTSKLSKNSDDHNQQLNETSQYSEQLNETASFNANLSSDSSGFQVLPSSWKPIHQQFRRRIRRNRPRQMISSESKETPASHSNSPHSGTPPVPLSWNEATDALRLPLGLIPTFIPNPGSTNAPGTTAYMLCRPPYSEPECSANDEDSYSRLSLFLGVYMNSEYLIQIPLRDKNATLFKYIQELSEKFELLENSSEYRLSKSIDGNDKTKNNYLIKLGYRFWDANDDCVKSSTLSTIPTPITDVSNNDHDHDVNESTIRTIYGKALLNKRDLRFTPSLDRPIIYTSSGIKIPIIDDNNINSNNNDDVDGVVVDNLTNKSEYSIINDYNVHKSYPPSDPEDILQLIKLLYQLSGLKEFNLENNNNNNDNSLVDKSESLEMKVEDFTSTRLTNKLLRQIHDPLALASGALPNWCLSLSQRFNILFSFNVRSQLFSACAFGPARAAIWLQNRPLQKRTYLTHSDGYSRAGSAGSASGRSSYRILLPSVNASLISALLNNTNASNNTTATTATNTNTTTTITATAAASNITNNALDDGNRSINSDEDIVLLRPSILNHLLNITGVNGTTNNNTSSLQNTDNNDFDINSDNISSVESILTGLGIPLLTSTTSTAASLNCDTNFLSDSTVISNNNNDLINCLLVHGNQNNQYVTTSMGGTATTPNGGGSSSVGIGLISDDRSTSQIGRLHKEFVRIPRLPHELLTQLTSKYMKSSPNYCHYHQSDNLTFWHWASRLMEEHASRKSELEIQFIGEEGTGLGPTLEFYSLLAAELRRHDGLMWVTNDFTITSEQLTQSHSVLPTVSSSATIEQHNSSGNEIDDIDEANIYVNTPYGLFPAPWPGDQVPESVLYRFFILGITVAKCLQDNRRIDLPLSAPLLKLLSTYGSVVNTHNCDHHDLEKCHSATCSLDNFKTTNNVDFSVLSDVESAFQNVLYGYSYLRNQLTSITTNTTNSQFIKNKFNPNDDEEFNLASFLISPQYKRLYQCCGSIVQNSNNNNLQSSTHWISGLLNLNDFCIIYPERAQFLKQIAEFHRRKSTISTGNTNDKCINDLAVEIFGCDLTDLCLSMEFLPSSKLFGFSSYPLKDVYHWEATTTIPRTTNNSTEESLYKNVAENPQSVVPVSIHNIEKYLQLTLGFCLDKGIRKQLDAFKDGFERVLPLHWLALFTGTELGELIAGDSVVHWTREDLLAYTVPSLGFTKQSPTYQMLINVLCNFNSSERRAFLQFTTGCSSLPPGGLKNLHPRLRIVRKEITNSGPYPSVNTCVHYLKLPEYQSEKELRTRLLQATKEIGFYLN
uniref:E3 ubiquitin-protein ligase n=1 Tax=Schistosoma haematobium TaxID=6185 RepID=A0A094ZS69_SCHHA